MLDINTEVRIRSGFYALLCLFVDWEDRCESLSGVLPQPEHADIPVSVSGICSGIYCGLHVMAKFSTFTQLVVN